MFDVLKETDLWRTFASKADDTHKAMVKDVVERAASLLDAIRDSFPTYTLHNYQHSLNIIDLMGKLLGARLKDISALEGAFLILSAFLHDIGMVFEPEERKTLREGPEFEIFLRANPKALVMLDEAHALEKEDQLPDDVAEWFCRWMHAKRVHGYLNTITDKLVWDRMPLARYLGYVCESHGWSVKDILSSDDLSKDFMGEADLKFCAFMLRLGDILDFDSTRTPEELYRYLGLSETKNAVSNTEWRKHFASIGFKFTTRKGGGYTLKYVAAPDDPAIEHEIRQFIGVIENELRSCASALYACLEKWHNFFLPQSIDTQDIRSKGYKYGEFHFTLEQDQILNLFMGENLYSNPYTFIRELLQNAIDTSRHRVVYEHGRGNLAHEAKPIEFSTWQDRDGYQWVRVDDYGMGMDEELILKYFLRVGHSYYASPQFKADMIRYGLYEQHEFVPISRFGIGILSCFLAGDRIEVSTKRIGLNSPAIRLSMLGIRSFYTLKLSASPDHKPTPMPNEPGKEERYRTGEDFGTSIAVRLDPRKDHTDFDLVKTLDKYVLWSTIPVQVNGKPVGRPYEEILKPQFEQIEIPFTPEQMEQVEKTLLVKFSEPLRLVIQSLNLTKYSPDERLKGQLILLFVAYSEADNDIFQSAEHLPEYAAFPHETFRHAIYIEEKLPIGTILMDHEIVIKFSRFPKWGNSLNPLNLKDIATTLKTELATYDASIAEIFAYRAAELIELYSRVSTGVENVAASEVDSVISQWRHEKMDTSTLEVETLRQRELRDSVIAKADLFLEQVYRRMNRKVELSLNSIISLEDYRPLYTELLLHPKQLMSHNGVQVPSGFTFWSPLSQSSVPLYRISLQDNLRPQLSLSRDEVKSFPWIFYSNLFLAGSRALRETISNTDYRLSELLLRSHRIQRVTLGIILSDPQIGENGSWFDEPIISTFHGKLSVREIRRRVQFGEDILLDRKWIFRILSSGEFEQLIAAVIQVGLNVRLRVPEGEIWVVDEKPPIIDDAQKFFPPLSFIPYDDTSVLFFQYQLSEYDYGMYPLNKEHRFSHWLLNHSQILFGKYPTTIIDRLMSLSNNYQFNRLIRHLQELDHDGILGITSALYLSEKDYLFREFDELDNEVDFWDY